MNHFQKTSKKLERLRGSFFLTGLIIAGGLTLLAFEWTSSISLTVLPEPKDRFESEEWEIPPIIFSEPAKKPEVKITQPKVNLDVIEIVPDKIPSESIENSKVIPEALNIDPNDLSPPEIIIDEDIPEYGAEIMPEFVGGLQKMKEFLSKTVKYPKYAKELGIKGKVFVSFVVGKDGSIRDVKIKRGVNDLLDQEAIRVVKAMPNWNPGKQHGKKVSVHYTLPINFTMR